MSNEERVEEILYEADKHGLRVEVLMEAKSIMQQDPNIDKVSAYELAFSEWVK